MKVNTSFLPASECGGIFRELFLLRMHELDVAVVLFGGVEGLHEAVVGPEVYFGGHFVGGVHGEEGDADVENFHVAHG